MNPQREGKREEKNGELYHRNHSSSCARSVVWSVECVVGIASERERKREQLAGPPRAPASFLASRRVCKLPRGRRTMVIPMEDWPCTLCRPQVRDANLLVAGWWCWCSLWKEGGRGAAHVRAELVYVSSSLSCKKKRGAGERRRQEERGSSGGGPARSGGEAAHAPRIGIDPTSRQHLVAPHVPR